MGCLSASRPVHGAPAWRDLEHAAALVETQRPASPDSPGCRANGCSDSCSSRHGAAQGPFGVPTMRTSRSTAAGASAAGTRASLGESVAERDQRGQRRQVQLRPCSRNCRPPSITSWSRCDTLPARSMFSRGASNRQPLAVTFQRALASSRSKSDARGRLLPSARRSGCEECMRAWAISTCVVTCSIRRSRRRVHSRNLAVPCSGTTPTERTAGASAQAPVLAAGPQQAVAAGALHVQYRRKRRVRRIDPGRRRRPAAAGR